MKDVNVTNLRKKLIIAIDGPSGAGKSTASKMLAKKLGFMLLNTGLLYRGVAYITHIREIRNNEFTKEKMKNCVDLLSLDGNQLFYGTVTITNEVINDKMSQLASDLSKIPFVRELVNDAARSIAHKSKVGVVTEGRDTCTVLFPDADVKIYMTADLDFRANMRYKQLKDSGVESNYEDVRLSIMRRDEQDSNRPIAPLTKSPEAILIDTSHMQLSFIVDWISTLVDVVSGNPVSISLGNPVSVDTASLRLVSKRLESLAERVSEIEEKIR